MRQSRLTLKPSGRDWAALVTGNGGGPAGGKGWAPLELGVGGCPTRVGGGAKTFQTHPIVFVVLV